VRTDERAALRADLARAAEGDRAALEPAFARLHPFVLQFCRRVVGPDLAEDATQEALVTLFAHLSAYDATRDPVPWALAFASNACRTLRKRADRRREVADPPELAGHSDPEWLALDRELRAAVQATLEHLSPVDADTLSLAMGDRPAGATFRKRLERAATRFRIAWSRR
jgi:RNA polymerase sigma-70 factor, ECF subfamily